MYNQLSLPKQQITHPILTDLFQELNDRIGLDTVVGIYLGGSLALGDFDETRSDLDFLIVLGKSIDDVMLDELHQIHKQIRQNNKNRLYTNYEGVYLTTQQAIEPRTSYMRAPHLGSDGHFGIENHGSEILIDLWKIRKSGFVVYGRSPSDVIGVISNKEMVDAKVELFNTWWLPKMIHRETMDDEYQAYAVLTMTRMLYGVANLDEVSKEKSAQWCIEKYPGFTSLIVDAQKWGPRQRFNKIEQVFEFIEFTNQEIYKFTSKS